MLGGIVKIFSIYERKTALLLEFSHLYPRNCWQPLYAVFCKSIKSLIFVGERGLYCLIFLIFSTSANTYHWKINFHIENESTPEGIACYLK